MVIRLAVIISIFCLLFSSGTIAAEDYTLGPGDALNISVWGVENLDTNDRGNCNYMIRPDGKISYPLVGEVAAAGYTVSEFEIVITRRLKEYFKDPKVTVNIAKYRTVRVYVLGEINKPGMYELEKQHNVLDAIGIANGYTKYAAKKSVFLLRAGQTQEPIKINLLRLLKKGDMSQNYVLNDGDVLFLQDSGYLNFARDILPFLTGGYYVTRLND